MKETTATPEQTNEPHAAPPPYSAIDTPGPAHAQAHAPSPPIYELHHKIGASASLYIQQNDHVLYYAASYLIKDTPDIILYAGYDSHGPQLALLQYTPFSKDLQFYIGGLKSPAGDDWDHVRRSGGSGLFSGDPTFRFESCSTAAHNGAPRVREKWHWQRTSDRSLGASRLSRHDYKLVDELSDEVVAVYAEHALRFGTHKGTITYRKKVGDMAEMAALMVLLGLLERSRRHARVTRTTFVS